jgi:hypothetical protein
MKNSLTLIIGLLAATAVYAQPGSQQADQDKKDSADLVVYPNPASNIVYIEYTRPVTGIEVYNILGQVMGEFKTTRSRNYVLDISELPNGMYYIRIRDEDNNMVSQKVIKQ